MDETDGWMVLKLRKVSVSTATFHTFVSHLREDEEERRRSDQETGGGTHRDEGAGFQRVCAACRHPVLRVFLSSSPLVLSSLSSVPY